MAIAVPDAALPYLLLQRTDYLALPKRKLLYRAACRVSGKTPIMTAVSLESRLRRRGIRRRFNIDMQREYADIREWLPVGVTAILDVGCGLGGIDVLLFAHYQRDPGLHFYLLDRTQTDAQITYGYKTRADFYNALDLTKQTLIGNGLPTESLTLVEARDDAGIDLPQQIDLVISLISWGFHYPVAQARGAVDLRRAEGHRRLGRDQGEVWQCHGHIE
jgi:hypothetical protein